MLSGFVTTWWQNLQNLTISKHHGSTSTSGPEVIKHFSCSTQLSMQFQLFIKTKIPTKKKFLALSLSDVVFMLMNVKMPTIVGILTFMSRIIFCPQLS